MAFREIEVLKVDHDRIVQGAAAQNEVVVPYILSAIPPDEWKQYFETHAPAGANAHVVDNTICYACPNDLAAIEKYGSCWHVVADLVDNANRHYLGLELQRQQDLGRQAMRTERHEEGPSEFETEWSRYMGRD